MTDAALTRWHHSMCTCTHWVCKNLPVDVKKSRARDIKHLLYANTELEKRNENNDSQFASEQKRLDSLPSLNKYKYKPPKCFIPRLNTFALRPRAITLAAKRGIRAIKSGRTHRRSRRRRNRLRRRTSVDLRTRRRIRDAADQGIGLAVAGICHCLDGKRVGHAGQGEGGVGATLRVVRN